MSKAKAQKALQSLRSLVEQEDHFATVIVTAKDDSKELGYETRKMNMDQDLVPDLRKIAVDNTPSGPDEVRLRSYDPGYNLRKDELFYVPVTKGSDVAKIANYTTSTTQAAVLDEEERLAEKLNFYSIVIGNQNGQRAAFYRKPHSKKDQLAISRKTGFRAIRVGENNRYERFDQKVFRFDEKIDFFLWKGFLFVDSVYNFQRVFKRIDVFQKKATKYVNAITDSVPISNVEKFEKACTGDTRMLSRLAQVAKKPYVEDLTVEIFKKVAKEFDLELKTTEENGTEKLVFDSSAESRWVILNIFDDNYLSSFMTDNRYEVNSKISVDGSV